LLRSIFTHRRASVLSNPERQLACVNGCIVAIAIALLERVALDQAVFLALLNDNCTVLKFLRGCGRALENATPIEANRVAYIAIVALIKAVLVGALVSHGRHPFSDEFTSGVVSVG
jgi:hypothetical protein